MPTLTVLYFAHLRDQRGCDQETVATAALTPAQLYDELARLHHLTFPRQHLLVAVNEAMTAWDAPLAEHDTVVFLPPVSGG